MTDTSQLPHLWLLCAAQAPQAAFTSQNVSPLPFLLEAGTRHPSTVVAVGAVPEGGGDVVSGQVYPAVEWLPGAEALLKGPLCQPLPGSAGSRSCLWKIRVGRSLKAEKKAQ